MGELDTGTVFEAGKTAWRLSGCGIPAGASRWGRYWVRYSVGIARFVVATLDLLPEWHSLERRVGDA